VQAHGLLDADRLAGRLAGPIVTGGAADLGPRWWLAGRRPRGSDRASSWPARCRSTGGPVGGAQSWTENKRAAVRAMGAWLVLLAADRRSHCPRAALAAGGPAPSWERSCRLMARSMLIGWRAGWQGHGDRRSRCPRAALAAGGAAPSWERSCKLVAARRSRYPERRPRGPKTKGRPRLPWTWARWHRAKSGPKPTDPWPESRRWVAQRLGPANRVTQRQRWPSAVPTAGYLIDAVVLAKTGHLVRWGACRPTRGGLGRQTQMDQDLFGHRGLGD
jgi:hypothetical protein